MIRAIRKLAICSVVLAAFPAHAGPAEDYIAARTKAATTIAEAVQAGKSPAQIDKLDTAARKDLEKRMLALLGPVRFRGLDPKPAFSPDTLIPNELGADTPDGLVFRSLTDTTSVLVSPQAVFADWLKARAADPDAPAAFKDGIGAAARDDFFYTLTAGGDAAFTTYVPLPVTSAAGEETYAALGMFAQDETGNAPPDSVVVLRVADGRVAIATREVRLEVPPMPACAAIWKDASAKADALIEAAQKAGEVDDAGFDEGFRMQEEAGAAFRACFAKEAAGKPVLAEATADADALLALTRGK